MCSGAKKNINISTIKVDKTHKKYYHIGININIYMEIITSNDPLNREERINRVIKLLEEAEDKGYGEITVCIHNHQIIKVVPKIEERWGEIKKEFYIILQ